MTASGWHHGAAGALAHSRQLACYTVYYGSFRQAPRCSCCTCVVIVPLAQRDAAAVECNMYSLTESVQGCNAGSRNPGPRVQCSTTYNAAARTVLALLQLCCQVGMNVHCMEPGYQGKATAHRWHVHATANVETCHCRGTCTNNRNFIWAQFGHHK